MFGFIWRRRAIAAEAQLSETISVINALNVRIASRATLISIHRDGRRNVFTFAKNGEIHRISTMGTWDDDIEAWSKALIEGE